MGGVDGFLNGGYIFNTDIALLLLQILIITILSRALGALIRLIKEPTVIAELLAGIILGPTVLGRIPNFTDTIFPASSLPMLNIVAQLGLILYMFVVGLEIDIKSMKEQIKTSVIVAIIGVAVPLVFALGLSFILYDPDLVQTDTNRGVFFLFLGVIFGTSALPVLARILSEYRLMSVRLGIFTMGVTTVDDLIGWPLLALTMAISGATSFLSLIWIFLALITFALILAFPVRFLLHFVGRKTRHQEVYSQTTIFFVMTIMFTMAWVAEIIGLSAVVGAFLVGICVPRFVNLPHQLVQRIEDLVTVVFLPLFFTIIGLNTRLGLLDTGRVWGYIILCTFTALISKAIGEGLPARFLGKFSWTESAVFGFLMSAKGLVALIILNLGITHNIITERLFAILVVTVLVNTMFVSPLVALVFRIGGNPYQANAPQFMNPNEEAINIMVCTNYSLTAPLMVSLAQSLVNYKQKTAPKVFITRLFEASNRPSDLVVASNPDKAKKNDDVIIAAAQRAKMLRLDVSEVISRMSSNYGEDIATEAVQRGVDLIVMGTKKTTLRGTTMNKIVSKCSSNVAVVLQRSLTGALKIDSILFVYKSGTHDDLALDYALKIVEAREARLTVIKIEQDEDNRTSTILQRLFRKNKIDFRTVKTDEELQNQLDVEVKNHLYSVAMTGWESPAIPILLALDETLPLVAVYANGNKEQSPIHVDVSSHSSKPDSKNFVLDEEEDMENSDETSPADNNNNNNQASSAEESINNSEEVIVIDKSSSKKSKKQVDEYVKLEDIE